MILPTRCLRSRVSSVYMTRQVACTSSVLMMLSSSSLEPESRSTTRGRSINNLGVQVPTEVRGLKDVVGGVKDSVDGLKESVDGLKNSMDVLKDSMDGLKDSMDGLKDLIQAQMAFIIMTQSQQTAHAGQQWSPPPPVSHLAPEWNIGEVMIDETRMHVSC
ncbi:hypothetical protein C8Q74DRAFT_282590 [Fomes fomentarius]|nr:hypothetical protein C8Q74DRAFT_282590 [Fomes fomentarius]